MSDDFRKYAYKLVYIAAIGFLAGATAMIAVGMVALPTEMRDTPFGRALWTMGVWSPVAVVVASVFRPSA